MKLYLESIDNGIFLVILALMGNFLAEILGCKTQKLLRENMFAKHIVCICMIYFAIDYSSMADPKLPEINALQTIIIYIFFILFTKMNLIFTIIAFIFLACTYITNSYINYYTIKDPSNSRVNQLKQYIKILYLLTICVILLGSGLYFKKQRVDHYKNWSIIKYIFGVRKCNWINK